MKRLFNMLCFLMLILIFIPLSFADECKDMQDVLNNYYNAVSNEDYNEYMDVMDIEFINSVLVQNLQAYKAYVLSIFEVFDQKNLSYKVIDCDFSENFGFIDYKVIGNLKTPKDNIQLDNGFVAVFHKINGVWKIMYIMREDLFFAYEDFINMYEYYNSSKEIFYDELNKSMQYRAYLDELSKIVDENELEDILVQTNMKNSNYDNLKNIEVENEINFWFIFLIVLVLIVLIYIIFKNYNNKNHKKNKN